MNFFGNVLKGFSSDLRVHVTTSFKYVRQGKLSGTDAADDGPSDDVVDVVRQVKQISAGDGAALVSGVLQPLQRQHRLQRLKLKLQNIEII